MIPLSEVLDAVRICNHIGDYEQFKYSGHPNNRVITCREDVEGNSSIVFSIFLPGICIHIYDDGTWEAIPDGDN
jgi:hypothetical protein